MELRELRYFVAVADTPHFGRAAEPLHIAQPSVSQQVARRERELGVRLFHRRLSVQLTAVGQALLPQALASSTRPLRCTVWLPPFEAASEGNGGWESSRTWGGACSASCPSSRNNTLMSPLR